MGVECAAVTAEADQIGPAKVPLPDIPAYLRSVYEIGRRSLQAALAALGVLFFYCLGTRTYAALTHPHQQGKAPFHVKMADIAGSLLFFFLIPVLIYPLQESLLRGRPLHFLAAIRCVLEESVNVMFSGIARCGRAIAWCREIPGACWGGSSPLASSQLSATRSLRAPP